MNSNPDGREKLLSPHYVVHEKMSFGVDITIIRTK